jgi:hypothetical protein
VVGYGDAMVCLNSGTVGIDACVDIIVNLVNASKE